MGLAHGCGCDIMSIGDNVYPYVTLLDPQVSVVWHRKFFAQRMAKAQGVRVNSRGIRFISSQYSVLSISSVWKQVGCISSTNCLCRIDTNTTDFGARLFPNYGETVYASFGVNDVPQGPVQDILFTECHESATKRY